MRTEQRFITADIAPMCSDSESVYIRHISLDLFLSALERLILRLTCGPSRAHEERAVQASTSPSIGRMFFERVDPEVGSNSPTDSGWRAPKNGPQRLFTSFATVCHSTIQCGSRR
jgi:hypothetical protein